MCRAIRSSILVLCVFFGFSPILLYAQVRPVAPNAPETVIPFPRLIPDPKALAFSHEGDYAWQELRDIALWASVTDEPGASAKRAAPVDYEEKVTAAVEALLFSLAAAPPATDSEKAERVLTFMHKGYLSRYNATQTRLDILLDSGRFNCVSSAVFYAILAKAAGLEVAGVVTKDHAFATVTVGAKDADAQRIDVETTNPFGFDPGNRKEFHDGFGKATGFAYVSPKNYRDRAAIGTLELVSLIMSNRVTEMEKARRFGDAVPLSVDRSGLLSNRPPVPNALLFAPGNADVLDRVFNYGATLLNNGHNEACLAWADAASIRYPAPERWKTFTDGAVNNMVGKELRTLKAENIDAARSILAAQGGRLSSEMAERLAASVETAEQAVFHNAFAALYNKKDYQAAFQTITNAVTKYPGSKQLAADLALAQKSIQ